jgi:threonylcarbamoyladenosine tRNA methylthiotransferase MtaB
MTQTIAFHTLGCKLNFAESSDLLRRFVNEGYKEVGFKDKADVYVINTCTVTQIAESKCRNAIRQAHHINPKAIIAVIGCFSQVNSKEIEKIEGVNIILGNDDKHLLIEKVKESEKRIINDEKHEIDNSVIDISSLKSFYSSYSSNDRTRAFLKVQDGCDYFCTYCEIPFARGRSRSCSIEEAVSDAKTLAKQGKKEIVITGVNIGDFGKERNETFLNLIKSLDKVEEIERYRISSIEPDLLSKEIIDFCFSSRAFLPHFHIPLQSGSNKVLKTMKRRYLREEFEEKVNYIHELMPNCFIAADVMVGANDETEDEWLSSYKFLESLPLAFIHVFTYSQRPNTLANKIGEVIPVHLRRQRSEELQKLAYKKKEEFYKTNINYEGKVLWEETKKDGKMYGFTDNYIRCQREYDSKYINTITIEKIIKLSKDKEYFIIEN